MASRCSRRSTGLGGGPVGEPAFDRKLPGDDLTSGIELLEEGDTAGVIGRCAAARIGSKHFETIEGVALGLRERGVRHDRAAAERVGRRLHSRKQRFVLAKKSLAERRELGSGGPGCRLSLPGRRAVRDE